ncbi:MAG: NMD3-related protein [Promethearchaeota archaeon]
MTRFCPSCGAPLDPATSRKQIFCDECFRKENKGISIEGMDIRIQICPNCYKFRDLRGNELTWHIPDKKNIQSILIQAIYYFVISKIKNNEAFDFDIQFLTRPTEIPVKRKEKIGVKLVMKPIQSQDLKQEYQAGSVSKIEIQYSFGSCPDCALMKSGYHNSVLQLRAGIKREENEELLNEMVKKIQDLAKQHPYHGLYPISAIENVKGGLDIKLLSKNLGKLLSQKLKKEFCIQIKESFKVIGPDHETGNNLKRLFFSIRLFSFFEGDVFDFNDNKGPVLITKVNPEMVELLLLESGKIEHVKPDKFKRENLIFQANHDAKVKFQVISRDNDGTILLLNLENYQESEVFAGEWLGVEKSTDFVEGFRYRGKIYIYPL